MSDKARALVDEVLRPLIEADGGTIELVSATEHAVTLRLGGTCSGCPGQPYTKTRVIEPLFEQAFGSGIRVTIERALTAAQKRAAAV